MPRLSRAESQARTREQLIETATTLFLRDGYFATSLVKVAEEAGFSTGAVYSNFDSKSDLALAVLNRLQATHIQRLGHAFTQPKSFSDKLVAVEQWAKRTIGESGWPRLEFEFALEASQDPRLVRETAERERVTRETLAAMIEKQLHDLGMTTSLSPNELARILLSLSIGLAAQRMVDPKVSPKTLTNALRALIVPAR
jgi:AcrR family transcriptional regulator